MQLSIKNACFYLNDSNRSAVIGAFLQPTADVRAVTCYRATFIQKRCITTSLGVMSQYNTGTCITLTVTRAFTLYPHFTSTLSCQKKKFHSCKSGTDFFFKYYFLRIESFTSTIPARELASGGSPHLFLVTQRKPKRWNRCSQRYLLADC